MAVLSDCPVPFGILRTPTPTYRGGPDGRSASIAFLVALNDVTAFIHHAIYSREFIDYGNGVTSERVIPLVYPDDPELHLVHYDIEYFGTPGGTGTSIFTDQFSHARILCEFAVLPFAIGGDSPYFTMTTDHGVSMETMKGTALTFPSGIGWAGDWALRVGTVTYTLTTFLGTDAVTPTISNLVGRINNAVFTVQGIGSFPIGTLRLDGVQSQYAEGMFSHTMNKTFSLRYRERNWNEVLNPVGVWEIPTLGTSGLGRFLTGNFEVLKSA